MLKKIIISGLLAASTTLAHADTPAPTRWAFSWTGFYSTLEYGFFPDYKYSGTFGGVDADHDGVIALNELTELKIDGVDYATCNGHCGVTSFSYKVGGALSFLAGESHSYGEYPEPGWSDTSLEYEAGVAIRYTVSYQMHYESWTYFFTPATVETITQLTPVPEPESYAMLGAGLLLLAGVARSRKKAGR
ncbi:PEP-CTERM sorting domain-containing protein [Duganella sp. HH101]|uniref:PEP-CTERM sorting domain-containing protein n=1 Tax=Duganella sp. HH101 TaxID=1781066 RepID=UPI0008748DFD|nr:PEP-CTERM sorting domain-containing protein [Duganella sp. HH101]OEZ97839.1 PEP-CTERM motif protein [Duganella sp. HH101]